MLSDAILDRLLQLHPKEIDLSLGRLERLLNLLGNPEKKLPPVVHVAGTNGKGSVCTYIRSALEADGFKVHSYSSPHLVKFHERIRLADKTSGDDKNQPATSSYISESELSEILQFCEDVNQGEEITFFEITTAAAFVAFSRHPADYVVLEVGLGGRLDATNVIDKPAVCAITSISIDHVQFLGDSISGIAFEKAGILKPEVACALSRQDKTEVVDVVQQRANEVGAPLAIHGQDWMAYEQQGRLVFQDNNGLLDLPLPRLPGRHQIDNAGVAIAALRLLEGPQISTEAIEKGLTTAEWPGRLQHLNPPSPLWDGLRKETEIWLDGGHNTAASIAIAQTMGELEEKVSRPLVIICGMLNTKDAGGFFEAFKGLVSQVIAITIEGEENAVDAHSLANFARQHELETQEAASLEQALLLADKGKLSPRILICGSLYLAGRVLAKHQS